MDNKTIFAVSTADSEMYKDNYRNSFTNHFPHIQENSFNYKMCLSSIDLEKSFKTIGRNGTHFILLNLIYNAEDARYQNITNIDEHKYIFFTLDYDRYQALNSYRDNTIHDYIARYFLLRRS